MSNQFNMFIRISLLMKIYYQSHMRLVSKSEWYLSIDDVMMRFEVGNDEL